MMIWQASSTTVGRVGRDPFIHTDEKGNTSTYPHSYTSDDHLIIINAVDF